MLTGVGCGLLIRLYVKAYGVRYLCYPPSSNCNMELSSCMILKIFVIILRSIYKCLKIEMCLLMTDDLGLVLIITIQKSPRLISVCSSLSVFQQLFFRLKMRLYWKTLTIVWFMVAQTTSQKLVNN